MQPAITRQITEKTANSESQLSALNERLNLALASSRQLAFDWHIPDDQLLFSGTLADSFKGLMLDTSKTWRSSALPSIIHADDLDNFRRRLHEALKGTGNASGAHYQVELRLKDSVHAWRWVSISGEIVERDSTGRAVRIVGTFSDIDERKRTEQQEARIRDLYAALSQVNQAIVRIRDRDSLLREVCRIAVEHGRFRSAMIGTIKPGGKKLIPVAAFSASGKTGEVELSKSAEDPEFGPAASFPFRVHGNLFGALSLFASEDDFFDTQLIELLEEMARDMSFALDSHARDAQRKAVESALLDSEKFKSAILTASLDCIVSIDHNGEIISFNEAAECTFGYRCEDVLGKSMAEMIIPPESRERHRQGLERFLSTGKSPVFNRRVELMAMRADGSKFPVELAIVPLSVQNRPVFTAFIRDISDLKRSEAILKDNAKRYRQLVELSPEATFVYQDDEIVLFNQAASRLLGAQHPTDLAGRSIFDFVHRDYHTLLAACGQASAAGKHTSPFMEQIWLRVDGRSFNAEIGATRLNYNGEAAVQVVVRDITERKRAEALQLGQNNILNMMATGVSLPEILTEIARFAERHSVRALCSISQLDSDGATLSEHVAPSLPRSYVELPASAKTGPWNSSCNSAAFSGDPVIVTDIATDPLWAASREMALGHGLRACSSWPIFGKSRKVLGTFALYFREPKAPSADDLQLAAICTNLAGIAIERRTSEERIRYLAHYDGLTSLPNRFLFKEYLDLALRNARRHGEKFAVLFLDLDKFKEINDTLGHDAGDLVLREMAKRLRSCLRHTDKIARMGGDEFYVLIEELNDGRHAAEVAQKLLDEAARPIFVGDTECRLSVSIGIGIYPDDGGDGHTLLRNADNAMYRAKDLGKNAFQFFTSPKSTENSGLAMLPSSTRFPASSKKQMRFN